MFSLQKKLKNESAAAGNGSSSVTNSPSGSSNSANLATNNNSNNNKRSLDLRQKLLQKEFECLIQLPVGCSIHFDNPDVLYQFKLKIIPDKDSSWYGGKFEFTISVPEGLVYSDKKDNTENIHISNLNFISNLFLLEQLQF
jgi:hypothetical protein